MASQHYVRETPVCTENSGSDSVAADERMRRGSAEPVGIAEHLCLKNDVSASHCSNARVSTGPSVSAACPTPQHDQADQANHPFGKTILPRRSCRNRLIADAHGLQSPPDNATVDAGPITDQAAWRFVPGKCFDKLPRHVTWPEVGIGQNELFTISHPIG